MLGIDSVAHGQYAGVCGAPLQPSRQEGGGSAGAGSFEVVPSLCVSERYDSNVFYAPPTPGIQPEDFVTRVEPILLVNYNGDNASGFLRAAGFSETYMKNPDLNYLGTYGTLSLNLDNSIKRVFPKASLNVIDTFSYAPLPPGFVNPAAGTSPGAPGNIQNVYAQGFLAFRTNNLTNNGTVSTSYATTASTSLSASYNHSMIRFGLSPSTQGVNLFNTTAQTGSVGGAARLSELDTLNIRYAHSQIEYASTTTSSHFITDSATIGWSRMLTPNFSAELGGGGVLISPRQTTYAVNAALIMNFLNSRATISYSHSAFPSIAGLAPVILIGDVFSLSAVQEIDRQWQLVETASFALSSGGSGLNAVKYDSIFGGVDIQYRVTSIWSTALSYSYLKSNNEFGLSSYDFDRQTITFSIRATWS